MNSVAVINAADVLLEDMVYPCSFHGLYLCTCTLLPLFQYEYDRIR